MQRILLVLAAGALVLLGGGRAEAVVGLAHYWSWEGAGGTMGVRDLARLYLQGDNATDVTLLPTTNIVTAVGSDGGTAGLISYNLGLSYDSTLTNLGSSFTMESVFRYDGNGSNGWACMFNYWGSPIFLQLGNAHFDATVGGANQVGYPQYMATPTIGAYYYVAASANAATNSLTWYWARMGDNFDPTRASQASSGAYNGNASGGSFQVGAPYKNKYNGKGAFDYVALWDGALDGATIKSHMTNGLGLQLEYWNGTGANANFTTTGNWSAGATPGSGAMLNFGALAGAQNAPNNNNVGLAAAGIRFMSAADGSNSAAYTLSGNAITLNGSIVNASTNNQAINLSIALGTGAGTIDTGTANLSIGGVMSGPGTAITKQGTGTLALSAANTGLGPVNVTAGALRLDFAGATTAKILPHGTAVTLGGASLLLNGAATATTQGLGDLGFGPGGSAITLAPGAGALTVNASNTWLRNANSAVNITLGGATLASSPNLSATSNVVVGGTTASPGSTAFAVVSGGGATNWATVSGGNVAAMAPGGYTADTYGAGINTDVTVLYPAPATFTTDTLAFRTPQFNVLGLTGANVLQLGGVLVGSQVGTNNTTITGGSLAPAGTELVVHQYNTAGKLTLDSQLVNGSAATTLTKAGPGLLELSNITNSYTGATALMGGTLSVSDNAQLGSGGGLIFNGGVLQVTGTTWTSNTRAVTWLAAGGGFDIADVGSTFTVSQALGGNGSDAPLTKLGDGKLILTGNNNYLGSTTISGGTLQVGSGGTSGQLGPGAVVNNATLIFNRTDANGFAVPQAISGSGSLVQAGTGTVVLTGSNTYLGTTLISAGTLQVGVGPTGTLGAGNVTDNATLAFNRSGTLTVANNIDGSGKLVQNGPGLVVLQGTNTYGGGTIINGGALRFDNLASAPAGPNTITVNKGGALIGLGAYADVNTWLGSGRIVTSSAGAMALTSASSDINVDFASLGYNSLSLGAVGNVTYSGTIAPALGFMLGGGGGTLDVQTVLNGPWAVTVNGPGTVVLSGGNGYSGTTTLSGGTLKLNNATALGNTANALAVNDGRLDLNGNSMTVGALSGTGAAAIITDASAGAGTTTLTTSFAGSNTFNGALQDGASKAVGLTLDGGGTLILTNNANYYSGTTTITSGTLQIGSGGGGTIGSGPVVNGGALVFNHGGASDSVSVPGAISGGGTITISSPGTTVFSGANGYGGLTTISAGTLQIGAGGTTGTLGTFDVTDNATLSFKRSDTITVGNNIGGTGKVAQNGTGLLVLQGTNGYAGGTVVNSGAVQFANAGALPGSGQITVNAGAALAATGAYGTVNDWLASGKVLNTSAGAIALTSANADTGIDFTTLPGYNALYLGALDNVTYSGTLTPGSSGYQLGGGGATLDVQTALGASAVTVKGPGTVVLSGANGQTATTLASGTLRLNNAAALGAATNNLAVNGGTLDLNTQSATVGQLSGSGGVITDASAGAGTTTLTSSFAAGTPAFAGVIQNGPAKTLALVKDGAGSLYLTGNNTYGGGTTISAGTLQVGNNTASGSLGSGAVVNNAALNLYRSDTYTYANAISGPGTLTKTGSSLAILTGTNSYGGLTTVSGGTLQVGNGAASGTLGTFDVTNNSVLAFSRSGTVNVANNLGGSGKVVQMGPGTLVLQGTNNYSSGTTVSGGVLQFDNAGAVPGTGQTTINAGGAMAATGAYSTVNDWLASGKIVNTSAGTIALTAANADTGIDFTTAPGYNALSLGAVGNVTYAGTLTPGSGGYLLGGGGGTLTLQTALSAAVPTKVAGPGTVAIGASGSLGDSAITVANGGTLAPRPGSGSITAGSTGAGTAGATLTLAAGSFFDMSDGAVGMFNVNQQSGYYGTALSLNGATLTFEAGAGGVDELSINRGSAYVSGLNTINITGLTGIAAGTYTLIHAPSGISPAGFTLANSSVIVGGTTYNLALSNSGGTDELLVITSAGGPLAAGSGTWKNGAANQNWTTNTGAGNNWATGYPSAAGQVATFDASVTNYAGGVVNVDAAQTVGGLVFNRSPGYTVGTSGGNAVTLDNGGSSATVTVSSGSHTIAAPVTLNSNLAASVANSADTLAMNGAISGTGKSLAKSGSGTLALGAGNSYTGGVNADAGTLQLNHADAIPVPAATTGQNLSVGDTAQVVLASGLPKAVQVRGLTMYGGTSPTGTVDLKNGQLVVDSTVSSLATIGAQIGSGYNPGDPDNPWKGPGITSSAAAAQAERYALGYALNSDFGELAWATWFSREVNNDSILIRFTYEGDVDLNGEVTTDDFDNWKQGYITHMSGWLHGDLDYSGDVTTDDFDLWKQVYVKHYAPLPDGSGGGKVATSAVPEPGVLVLLTLAGLGCAFWLRRRK